ncbi:unnamed protein product [Prorocentrum cordatum]|uniref:Uncharacterized protein n=1 Tax=Prorocentrum cordatum TaxID=2364126 RepID=A0ABN9UJP4_9DINO|nr:unnamed protein product [Polarella glacialis]
MFSLVKQPAAALPEQAGEVEDIIDNAVRAGARATHFWATVLSFPELVPDLASWLKEQARTRSRLSELIQQHACEYGKIATPVKRHRLSRPRKQCSWSVRESAYDLQWLAPAWQAIAVFLPLRQRVGIRTWSRAAKALKFSSEAWDPLILDQAMCAQFLRRTEYESHGDIRRSFPPGFFNVRIVSVDLMIPDQMCSQSESSDSEGSRDARIMSSIICPLTTALQVVMECFKSLQQLTITNIKADEIDSSVFFDRRFHTRFRRQEMILDSGTGEPLGRYWASNVADPVVVDVEAAARMNHERSPPWAATGQAVRAAAPQLSRAEALLLVEFPFLHKPVGEDSYSTLTPRGPQTTSWATTSSAARRLAGRIGGGWSGSIKAALRPGSAAAVARA